MSEKGYDSFIVSYKQFFDRFVKSVNYNDQLPVKVGAYNLVEHEIPGAVADWALQYLEQRNCPPCLQAFFILNVIKKVKSKCQFDLTSCGFRLDSNDFSSLRLMQICIEQLVELCSTYISNVPLSSLPPPPDYMPKVTSYAVKNGRRSMEDRHVVIHDLHTLFNIKANGPASYYGVFDGHNGVDAAIYSVSHLHQYLVESRFYPQDPVKAMTDACIKTDEEFCLKSKKEKLHGGTTAVFALLRLDERKLYVAWVGDSQAVLVRQGWPLELVHPHKPNRDDEKIRIYLAGGEVVYWGTWRVNGQLAVSRAIGDIEYKPSVIAEPDLKEITLDGNEDFLILASDGLWDFVTAEKATQTVYKLINENPEDLASVSHQLVALAKEESSSDNISVVVVFLTSPAEIVRRRAMETAGPNPFTHNGEVKMFHDEDFGPETDVDMVDDVLLSPAIAAAKALVAGCDDLERQRQQLADYDDPADLYHGRDTPTPPADEVAGNIDEDPLAESGGEESEEEWNYISGTDTKTKLVKQEEEDMSSQLNPNAAEFVPVSPVSACSPTKLLLMDDAIISASPRMGFEKSLEHIQVPSEAEFYEEVSIRPGDLGITNGPKAKPADDYFMRDNFSTLRNKSPDFNSLSTCAQVGDDSIFSLPSSLNSSATCGSETIPFDKLEAVQNIAGSKEMFFGSGSDVSSNKVGETNCFGNIDVMKTSITDEDDFTQSPENDEHHIPGTPKSTIVEAPVSPVNEDVLTINHQDFDSSAECALDMIKTSTHMNLDNPDETSGLDDFDVYKEVKEIKDEEDNDGFITEHRRSPPIDLSFKPIQAFSDTNPFGSLLIPSTTTPLDQNEISHNFDSCSEPKVETPVKASEYDSESIPNTPSSFILPRQKTPLDSIPVPFNELESPKDMPDFVLPPNCDSSVLASELPTAPESQDPIDSDEKVSNTLQEIAADEERNKNYHDDLVTELPMFQESNVETSNITDAIADALVTSDSEATSPNVNLDTTEGFLIEESKIMNEELYSQQPTIKGETLMSPTEMTHESFGDIVNNTEILTKEEGPLDVITSSDNLVHHNEIYDSDFESETKEMNLELESHIVAPKSISEDLEQSEEEGYEVISKDELKFDESTEEEVEIPKELVNLDQQVDETLSSPVKETNPFMNIEEQLTAECSIKPDESNIGESSTFNEADNSNDEPTDNRLEELHEDNQLLEEADRIEPETVKVESYQLLTPADEPICTKTNAFITEDEVKTVEENNLSEQIVDKTITDNVLQTLDTNPALTELLNDKTENGPDMALVDNLIDNEPITKRESVLAKIDPVKSQVVTETLITALEETSEIPSQVSTEAIDVPSTTDTPLTVDIPSKIDDLPSAEPPSTLPPTPTSQTESNDDSDKTKIVAVAGIAAGVAAAATLVADKTKKDVSVASKKPSLSAGTKKPGDVTSKAATSKPLATKPMTSKTLTTTKPAASTAKSTASTKPTGPPVKSATLTASPKTVSSKPSTATAATKKTAPLTKPTSAGAAKPLATAAKPLATASKPASSAAAKPTTTTAAKPTTTTTAKSSLAAASKPSSTTSAATKPVPKHLPVNKTAPTLKPTSKPTTPTSKPTTPTTPKSPYAMKNDVKSPGRSLVKSSVNKPLTAAKSSTENSTEKKSLTNGEVKLPLKKDDIIAKKPTTTSATKPTATSRPASTVSKAAAPATKAPTAATKPAANKPLSTAAPKAKPTTTVTKQPAPALNKKPTSATGVKAAEKTGKDAGNKQSSSAKPAVNGKSTGAKTVNGAKKTDAKMNSKNSDKLEASKKVGDSAQNDDPAIVQEYNITTTNGFGDHDEHIDEFEVMQIDGISHIIIENVN